VHRGRAALGRAAGIEDPDVLVLLDLRYVRVAVNHRVTVGKATHEPDLATRPWARDVHHAESRTACVDDALARQSLPQRRLVHVPDHGLDRWAEPQELLQEAHRDEVAGVQDQVGRLKPLLAGSRKPPRAAREMSVGNDRDERSVFYRTWNGRLTKRLVRDAFVAAASRTA
jgi:hypothetical protein